MENTSKIEKEDLIKQINSTVTEELKSLEEDLKNI